MNYIKSYSEFDNINEEIDWKSNFKSMLWGLLIASSLNSAYKGIFGKKDIDQLFTDIKKQEAQPSSQTSKFFNNLRQEIISQIQNSDRIDSSNKEKIIDSLKTIPFYIIDSERYKKLDNTYASFMSLPRTSRNIKELGDNYQEHFITINKNYLNDTTQLANSITHEIYHYVDDLMGKPDMGGLSKDWSEVNNIAELADPLCLSNKEYMQKKLKYLLFGTKSESSLSENESDFLKESTEEFWENRNYYTKPSEMFVRFQNMKRWLISEGQMKSMNDKVEEKHLDYLFKKDFYDLCFKKQLDFPILMIFMSMRETSDMNKIISKAPSEPNKNA